jgi:hypothetical protein
MRWSSGCCRKPMHRIFIGITLLFLLAACGSPVIEDASPTRAEVALPSGSPTIVPPTASHTPSPIPSHTVTATPSPSPTPSETALPTVTATSTVSPTPTITPTWSILRAKVLEQANCRYGPGHMYLYKYGLYPDFNIEVFGRTEVGDWVLIRAIGGTNPCWVKASLLDIKGDVMALEPTYIPLPQSPYYGPLTGVFAARSGIEVSISWNLFVHRAGDEPDLYTQLVEAWLCQGGKLVFTPIGTFDNFVTVIDEPGCTEPSHARVYGVEKHGYTYPVEVPWPPYVAP